MATPDRIPVPHRTRPHIALRRLTRVMVLAASYFLLARLSGLLVSHDIDVSLVWLPAGLALAAVLLRGPAMLPGVAIGALVDELTRSTPLTAALGIAAAATLAAGAGAALLRRFDVFNPPLDRPRQVVLLLGAGATAAPLLAAVGGVAALAGAGLVQLNEAGVVTALWASGDALGVLLVATLVLAWSGPGAPVATTTRSDSRVLLPLCLLQALIVAAIFLPPRGTLGPAAALACLPAGSYPLRAAAAALGGGYELPPVRGQWRGNDGGHRPVHRW